MKKFSFLLVLFSFTLIIGSSCKKEKTFRESQILDSKGVKQMHDERGKILESMGVMTTDEYKFVVDITEKYNLGIDAKTEDLDKIFSIVKKNKNTKNESTMASEISTIFIYGRKSKFPSDYKSKIHDFGDYITKIKTNNKTSADLLNRRGKKIMDSY